MHIASVAAQFRMPAGMTLDRYPANMSAMSICVSTGDALARRLGRRPAQPIGSPRVGSNLQVSFLSCLA
jgi:hypothetical protein